VDLGFFGFAFVAGALATVNPCGFVMLPALVAVQLRQTAGSEEVGRAALVARGIGFGLRATMGFLVVFGVLGLAVGLGARSIVRLFPFGGAFVGVVLLAIGLYSLLGRRPLPIPGLGRGRFGRPASGGVAFGAAYAVASLSCTLPIFLAVVGGTLLAEGIGAALLPFIGYAAGMGGVLLAVTLATALSAGAVVRVLRRTMPFVEQAGSVLLVGIGVYLVAYWVPRLVPL
jgi:cytochrome c-type biogenesis protein